MGPLHHFFGYYGIDAWDPSGRFHLALETDFHRRPPSPADTAAVGLVDRETGEFSKVSATRAFNLQQGSMLQWIDTGRGPELTHNDWDGGRTVSRAIALGDRSSRTIDSAIAAVSPDGTAAMGLSSSAARSAATCIRAGPRTDGDSPSMPSGTATARSISSTSPTW